MAWQQCQTEKSHMTVPHGYNQPRTGDNVKKNHLELGTVAKGFWLMKNLK